MFGRYRKYQHIDFKKIKRVVFICSGNICRSPLGEYIAKNLGMNAESFGLNCRGGDPADSRAIAFAKTINIDMSEHRTRNISDYNPLCTDLLIVMEPAHIIAIDQSKYRKAQLTLLLLWADKKSAYLHDPFCANNEFFIKCESSIVESVKAIHKKMAHKTE